MLGGSLHDTSRKTWQRAVHVAVSVLVRNEIRTVPLQFSTHDSHMLIFLLAPPSRTCLRALHVPGCEGMLACWAAGWAAALEAPPAILNKRYPQLSSQMIRKDALKRDSDGPSDDAGSYDDDDGCCDARGSMTTAAGTIAPLPQQTSAIRVTHQLPQCGQLEWEHCSKKP